MNMYKLLSNNGKDMMRNETYCSIIGNSLKQMFTWSGIEFDQDVFETILLTSGKATLVPYEDGYTAVTLQGMGTKKPNNRYENYTAYYINNEIAFEDRPEKQVAVCRNTSDGLPALNIGRFADMLSEVDLSMVFNLQRSRLAPIPIAKTRAIMTQLKNIFSSIKNGTYDAISADLDRDFVTGKAQSVEMINLNDPKAIEYMNYLSELHDALTRRLYTMYGMAVQETSKHAQVNKDESNARDGVSWLIPDNMLRMRKKFCDEFNALNGTNLTVRYNELFIKERELMNDRSENNDTGNNSDTVDTADDKSDSNESDNFNGK